MSTILKTLKKLEEEKSVLEKGLDLKSMVLKEETSYPKAVQIERSRFLVIAAMAMGGFLAGGGALYLLAPTEKKPAPVSFSSSEARVPVSVAKKFSSSPRFEGIPMRGITDEEIPESNPPSVRNLFTPLATEEAAPQAPSPTTELEEIDRLIHSATRSAKKAVTASPSGRRGQVPGIKVKGIIFFDEGSPANHIIVATSTHRNIKLRTGDSAQNAVLKSIHPNRVIFSYQDQLIETGIGY